jgi:hypothetical protein
MPDAIMQWEMDRERFKKLPGCSRYRDYILREVLEDTVNNHGTFVVISTPDTLTIVQRPYKPEELEELDNPIG